MKLTSPDGKSSRDLASLGDAKCTFSRDGSQLDCLRSDGSGPGAPLKLFAANLEGKVQRIIGSLGPEFDIAAGYVGGHRLSLSPDGASITYSIEKDTGNLWMIEGLSTIALLK